MPDTAGFAMRRPIPSPGPAFSIRNYGMDVLSIRDR